jgi:hypothetical protein
VAFGRFVVRSHKDEALSHVLTMHNEHLEQSADGAFEHGTIDGAQAAARTLALIGAVVRSQVAALSPDQFRRILFAFSRWAHFNALEAYRDLHANEQQLLFSSVEQIRAALEQRRGAPLPEPPWWDAFVICATLPTRERWQRPRG